MILSLKKKNNRFKERKKAKKHKKKGMQQSPQDFLNEVRTEDAKMDAEVKDVWSNSSLAKVPLPNPSILLSNAHALQQIPQTLSLVREWQPKINKFRTMLSETKHPDEVSAYRAQLEDFIFRLDIERQAISKLLDNLSRSMPPATAKLPEALKENDKDWEHFHGYAREGLQVNVDHWKTYQQTFFPTLLRGDERQRAIVASWNQSFSELEKQWRQHMQTLAAQWKQAQAPYQNFLGILQQVFAAKNLAETQIQQLERATEQAKALLTQSSRRAPGQRSPSGRKLSDPSVVRIFQITPPPEFDFRDTNFEVIQKTVWEKLNMFAWPQTQQGALKSNCHAPQINSVQRLSYHYMHPFSPGLNVLLAHSAGSGKTCTLRLINSIFARAGYDSILSTSFELKDGLIVEASHVQCDFNVQQYTRGAPSEKVVIQDMVSRIAEKTGERIDIEKIRSYVIKTLSVTKDMKVDQLEAFVRKGMKAEDDEKIPNNQESKQNLRNNVRTWIMRVILEKEMKYRQYSDANSVISYKQLSNLTKGEFGVKKKGTGVAMDWLQQGPHGEDRQKFNDPLRKVFLGVDEAHKLTARPGANVKDDDMPKFSQLRSMIWDSYEASGPDAVRVCLATATPIVNHPLDLINLASLLAPASLVRQLRFEEYGRIDGDERDSTEKRFMEREFQNGRFKREDDIRALLAGRVSYFNMLSDNTRFSQPYTTDAEGRPVSLTVQFPQILLSTVQISAVAGCLSLSGTPETRKVVAQRVSELFEFKNGVIVSQGADKRMAPFVYPVTRKGNKKGESRRNKKKEDDEEEEDTSQGYSAEEAATLKCLRGNVTWPWLKGETQKSHIDMSLEERRAWFEDGRLEEKSPLIAELLRNIEAKENEAKLYLSQQAYHAVAHPEKMSDDDAEEAGYDLDPSDRMQNRKHFIFVDHTEKTDHLGTKNILKWLEVLGFRAINKGEELLKGNAAPYRGVLVLDNETKDSKKIREVLLEEVNSHDNRDGRRCLLILANGNFKEGISLKHIYYEHICGFMSSDADVQQAAARGIRACSRSSTPFPWTVDITIYSPALPNHDPAARYPFQLFQLLNPGSQDIENAKTEMRRLMIDTAFDKLLLQTINRQSEAFLSLLKPFAA